MKGSSKPRAGAVRKAKGKQVGSGGQGRQALEGKGPTPKAEDRAWHPAGKRKAAEERYRASGGRGKPGQKVAGQRGGTPRGASGASRRAKTGDESEIVTGRNPVVHLDASGHVERRRGDARAQRLDDRVATGHDLGLVARLRPT